MIYFLRDDKAGAIKIGYAADVAKRVRTLQTGNPTPLQLVGAIPGTMTDESRYHRRFAAFRVHPDRREWFRADAELVAAVNALVGRYGATAGEPEPDDMLYSTGFCCGAFGCSFGYQQLRAETIGRTLKATGIPAAPAWGAEPHMTGATGREASFQLMPEASHERHPFWGWHVDNNPQWFVSVGHAIDGWVRAFRYWNDHGRPRETA